MNSFKMGDALWEQLVSTCNNREAYWAQAKRDDIACDVERDRELHGEPWEDQGPAGEDDDLPSWDGTL